MGDTSWPAPVRRLALAAVWVVCLGYAAQRFDHARDEFSTDARPPDRRRPDGNRGHTLVDFGGQWVMGRMVATGRGRELYHRQRQWPVVWAGFPPADESPAGRRNPFPRHLRGTDYDPDTDHRHDAEMLMHWFMGDDSPRWDEAGTSATLPVAGGGLSPNPFAAVALTQVADERLTPTVVADVNKPAIGGPLYPPVHGCLYAPLGLFDRPQDAYLAFQALSLGLTFLAGYGVSKLSDGRVWWPAATLVILLFPGYRSGLDLGQNQVVSLTILVWGWVFAARGRDYLGGAVWGLLAFKPVWAAAFFLAPLLLGRWRFCFAMAASGIVLCGATLPAVGTDAWFDWLAVGREASALYGVNKNWITLSRDLAGIPRRFLIDFTVPEKDRYNATADLAGWGLWAAVFLPTLAAGVWAWLTRQRPTTGRLAGFVLLGAYLCCYRFMYYDAVLAVLPVAALLADPRRAAATPAFDLRPVGQPLGGAVRVYASSVPLTLLVGLLLVENWLFNLALEGTVGFGGHVTVTTDAAGATAYHTPRVSAETTVYYPWDTGLLLLMWAWSGVRLLWAGRDA